MEYNAKTLGLSALAGLVIGLLVGYIPAHMQNSDLTNTNNTLTQNKSELQGQFNKTQYDLGLSKLAERSGLAYADAEKNNFSVAQTEASQLFTNLRKVVDRSSDQNLKQQLGEILATRDSTIAALAKADPAVKQRLQEIFRKMIAITN